jgi:hypothetical protein
MRDREAHLEKLRNDSEECALMTKLAANPKKRELFARLTNYPVLLASEVERLIAAKAVGETRGWELFCPCDVWWRCRFPEVPDGPQPFE